MANREYQHLGRHFDEHIDNEAFHALVPWPSATGQEPPAIPADKGRRLASHLALCPDCREKVDRYREEVSRFPDFRVSDTVASNINCPAGQEVDWQEVASGMLPESRAVQLILHAALCEHCGPLLRTAASLNTKATSEEERLAANLQLPSQPRPFSFAWPSMKWALPVIALLVIVGILSTIRLLPSRPLSGSDWAKLAAEIHRQHASGNLPLAIRSESPQALNTWLKSNLQFPLTLPITQVADIERLPFHLQGARPFRARGKNGVFVAYQMESGLTSLTVSPDSVAVASGGVEAHFKKVSFHYAMVDGYKVVTWSQHGLTYALVSQESTGEQKSCMICHSAMRDRDLSHTPTPLQPASHGTGPL